MPLGRQEMMVQIKDPLLSIAWDPDRDHGSCLWPDPALDVISGFVLREERLFSPLLLLCLHLCFTSLLCCLSNRWMNNFKWYECSLSNSHHNAHAGGTHTRAHTHTAWIFWTMDDSHPYWHCVGFHHVVHNSNLEFMNCSLLDVCVNFLRPQLPVCGHWDCNGAALVRELECTEAQIKHLKLLKVQLSHSFEGWESIVKASQRWFLSNLSEKDLFQAFLLASAGFLATSGFMSYRNIPYILLSFMYAIFFVWKTQIKLN